MPMNRDPTPGRTYPNPKCGANPTSLCRRRQTLARAIRRPLQGHATPDPPSMLIPAEVSAVVVPSYATMPAAPAVRAPARTVPAPAPSMSTLAAMVSLNRADDRNRQGHRSDNDQS